MTNRLFVGGLDYSVSDDQLTTLFSQFGQVTSAKVITDRYTGQGKGFGFVEMATTEEAKTAMDKMNGTQVAGRTLSVKEAKPQENRNDNNTNRGNNRW